MQTLSGFILLELDELELYAESICIKHVEAHLPKPVNSPRIATPETEPTQPKSQVS